MTPQTRLSQRQGTTARQRRLVDLLHDQGPLTTEDLAATLRVSTATVRRDLLALEERGELVRTLGGAIRVSPHGERSWHEKERKEPAAKRAIALAASRLVEDDQVVLLDAGTTTGTLASILCRRPSLTLVVLGISALLGAADGKAEVLLLGGRLRAATGGFVGTEMAARLEGITPDVAFLGCDAIDPVRGVNCPDPEVSAVKTGILLQSKNSWVLADHTKLEGKARFAFWVKLPANAGVITDSTDSSAAQERGALLRERNQMIVAPLLSAGQAL